MGKRQKGLTEDDVVLKAEIIEGVAEVTGHTKKASAEIFDAVFSVIKSKLAEDKVVHISGFGIFSIREMKAKNTVNPRNGEPMTVKSTATIRFKPLKASKDVARKAIQPDSE